MAGNGDDASGTRSCDIRDDRRRHPLPGRVDHNAVDRGGTLKPPFHPLPVNMDKGVARNGPALGTDRRSFNQIDPARWSDPADQCGGQSTRPAIQIPPMFTGRRSPKGSDALAQEWHQAPMSLCEIIIGREHGIRIGNEAVFNRNNLVAAISEQSPPTLRVVVPTHPLAPPQTIRVTRNRLHHDGRKVGKSTLPAKCVSEDVSLHRSLTGQGHVLVIAPTTFTRVAAWRLHAVWVGPHDGDNVRPSDSLTHLGHLHANPLPRYAMAHKPGTAFVKCQRAPLRDIVAQIDFEDVSVLHGDHVTANATARS